MAENRNAQQVREITDKLEQGIKELFESERFKEYLRTMSKFYNYSFNNTLLIAMQKPEANTSFVSPSLRLRRHTSTFHFYRVPLLCKRKKPATQAFFFCFFISWFR